jgi:cysteine-rich repeat protein
MMTNRLRLMLPPLAAIFTVLSIASPGSMRPVGTLAAAEPHSSAPDRPPAGQMCPRGSFVIGFDPESNIVCSQVCGNGVLDSGESCDDGNLEGGDGCSPACRTEAAAAAVEQDSAEPAPLAVPDVAPGAVELAITDVEPSSVLYGTQQVTVTVTGSGFAPDSRVLFDGSTYEPSVEPSGTRLTVTLPTRQLTIGKYAITVTDGSDRKSTYRKALVVY